ncbi:MAG: hydrogenase formation protein HypD [Desulfovibrionaceae bacterium]|nr:hydrogenase formation protein HypD [Desulfovibrionaceae bacterium]
MSQTPPGREQNLASSIENAMQDPALCRSLLDRLEKALDAVPNHTMRFMEVCGTHTVSLFQSGLRSLLPAGVVHLSGPGCPVCVTHDSEVAAFLEMARMDRVCIATFGDLIRVPGPNGESLKHAMADGALVKIVYSPLDALTIAAEHPDWTVVFIGIGFETTAPTVAGTLVAARQRGLVNFCVLSLHKLVPPALKVLLADRDAAIDAFLLPGHVCMVTGLEPFEFLSSEWKVPACVGGFTPADMALALCHLAEDLRDGAPRVSNAYPRAVPRQGNPMAMSLMQQVFEPCDALWRGLGVIPDSGLRLRGEYAEQDAMVRLGVSLRETKSIPGCRCGDVLKGRIAPNSCPLFGRVCTPMDPVGPCMVSTEGSCAAYYKYAI